MPVFQRFFDGFWVAVCLFFKYIRFLYGSIPVFTRFLLTAKLELETYTKPMARFYTGFEDSSEEETDMKPIK